MSSETERLQKIAQFYDTETDDYDNGYSSITCRAEDAVVADILSRYLKGRVLDVGAGSGLLYEIMDHEEYVGIELSPKMTHQAKLKHPEQPFIVADMHHLPFADESFDSAVSLYGPMSYSLSPEELLGEIVRVVKPGGFVALMPYTLRVGHGLEMGGYSTATEKGIDKVFYTEEQLKELFSRKLENVEVFGINYFLNTYTRFLQAMNYDVDQTIDQFVEFLMNELTLRQQVPAEFARHMIGIGQVPNR